MIETICYTCGFGTFVVTTMCALIGLIHLFEVDHEWEEATLFPGGILGGVFAGVAGKKAILSVGGWVAGILGTLIVVSILIVVIWDYIESKQKQKGEMQTPQLKRIEFKGDANGTI